MFNTAFQAPVREPLGGVAVAPAWWNGAYAAYDAKNAASYSGSQLDKTGNLRHLTSPLGNVNWAAGAGWSGFSALSRYLLCPFSPVANQQWGMSIKFSGASIGVAMYLAGSEFNSSPIGRFEIRHTATAPTNAHSYQNGGSTSFLSVAPNLSSGVLAFSGTATYRDGAPEGSIPVSTSASAMPQLVVGALNLFTDGITGYTDATISSVVVWNALQTPAWMAYVAANQS